QRGALTEAQLQKALSSVRGTFTWNHFDKLQLVLDTTDAELTAKQQLYRDFEEHAPATALLMPISSRHRVADLQQGLRHPGRLIGWPVIEPGTRGLLAEIVAPSSVAPDHAQRVREWAVSLGKCCLPVQDKVGGLAMRIWMPALNEAGVLIKEGVA